MRWESLETGPFSPGIPAGNPYRGSMAATPPSAPAADHVSAVDVHAEHLVVRSRLGSRVVGPLTFDIAPGALALATGDSPAGRWALAAALTGRLPLERMRAVGSLSVGGMTTPPMIRNVSVLAQSWRMRRVPEPSDRRLGAMAWARRTDAGLVVLSPGLDGLDAAQRQVVLIGAQELAAEGRTVLVTAPQSAIGAAERHLVSDTIALATVGRTTSAA